MLDKIYDEYEHAAYVAGRDCALNGSNTINCHFKYFTRPALTAAWEMGKKNGETERKSPK